MVRMVGWALVVGVEEIATTSGGGGAKAGEEAGSRALLESVHLGRGIRRSQKNAGTCKAGAGMVLVSIEDR